MSEKLKIMQNRNELKNAQIQVPSSSYHIPRTTDQEDDMKANGRYKRKKIYNSPQKEIVLKAKK